jgi:hypothetical protein
LQARGTLNHVKRILVATILLLVILYASDYLFAVIRKNNPKARQAFGTVTVQHYYSIPHKDGKAELVFQDPQTQACIRSLFPHFGYTPCWYARRESQTPIPMIIVAWRPAQPIQRGTSGQPGRFFLREFLANGPYACCNWSMHSRNLGA